MRNVAILTLAIALAVCCSGSPRRLQRRIIIFPDVTLSLAPDQMATVQNIVDEIVKKLPGGAELVVVPICENTQGVGEYTIQMPVQEGFTRAAKKIADDKRTKIQSEVRAFIARMLTASAAKSDYASCISPALLVTKNAIDAQRDEPWATDVIFVSDMIEECRASILGQPVRLKLSGNQFATAKRLANDNRQLLSVGDARVFVILPKTDSTARPGYDVPLPSELQSFWQRLFARSGIGSKCLWWDASVNDYVRHLQKSTG